MYAIVEIKGKQYKVSEKTVIAVDFLDTQDTKFICNNVLSVFDDKTITFGTPIISDACVEFDVLEAEHIGEKIRVHTFKPKTGKQKGYGARQTETILRATSIKTSSKNQSN